MSSSVSRSVTSSSSSSSCGTTRVPVTPLSPLSETASSRLPSSPGTGAIWAELAALTVAAFSEPLVARLRAFIDRSPRFDDAHLQMLGPIVVRHVALMLQDMTTAAPPPCTEGCCCRFDTHCYRRRPRSLHVPSSSNTPSSPSNGDSPPRNSPILTGLPRRASYREVAYQAVRLNKILPESMAAQPHPDSSSKIVRKLSITTPIRRTSLLPVHLPPSSPPHACDASPAPSISLSPLGDEFQDPVSPDLTQVPVDPSRSKSKPKLRTRTRVDTTSPLHPFETPRTHRSPFTACEELSPQISVKNPARHREPVDYSMVIPISPPSHKVSTRWRHQLGRPDPKHVMPRAGVNVTLESCSVRAFKSRLRHSKRIDADPPSSPNDFPQNHVQPPQAQSGSSHLVSNPSRLVLLRRQREKRRSSFR